MGEKFVHWVGLWYQASDGKSGRGRWRRAGWYRGETATVPNADLWEKLLGLCEQHEVTMTWIRGHSGEPGNERCDQLATAAARGPELLQDVGYETPSFPPPRRTLFDELPD